jgi:hypothetical protein
LDGTTYDGVDKLHSSQAPQDVPAAGTDELIPVAHASPLTSSSTSSPASGRGASTSIISTYPADPGYLHPVKDFANMFEL